MRVGVTGASGLIGHAVCAQLQADGLEVRRHAGPPGVDAPGAQFAIDDAAAVAAWAQGLDGVVHLAGPPWIGASFEDPVGTWRAHGVGTAAVCAAARAAGARLVFVSSAAVYPASASPLREAQAGRPGSPYGAVKLGAEALVRSLGAELPAAIVRPFNVYGARSPRGSVVGRVLAAARRGAPVQVQDPRPVRDFVHVADVARGVVAALAAAAPEVPTWNLGTGRGTAVGDLAACVARLAGVPASPTAGRAAPLPVPRQVADASAAAHGLGWVARIGLRDGLRRSLEGEGP